MSNIKSYRIEINGVKESIDAITLLNERLQTLEARMKAIEGKSINVSAKTGGNSDLSGQDKLQKQIIANEEKIASIKDEQYKKILEQKAAIKEVTEEQKKQLAEQNLVSNSYENTMQGMKRHLADIKTVLHNTDLGDGLKIEELTKQAGELTNKLLEMEKAYGTFSRGVGNYASAAEGFKGLKLTVGDTAMEFDNARQALKALKQEMQTLSTKKDLGVISEDEVKRLESLIPTVKQLESSIQDAGKPMDAIMDNMQSIVALASAGKGLAAFFGIDDTEINESIQNLVALQNVLTSLQTLQNQMQTGEGFGKYFSKGSAAIDKFTNKLFGVKKATEDAAKAEKTMATATNSVASSSKGATTSMVAQTAASAGMTVGMKLATVAARALGAALKAIGIGILLEGISLAIDGIKSLISWLTAETEAEKRTKEVIEAGNKAYAEAQSTIVKYTAKIKNFNGGTEEEKKLVEELNKNLGEQLGTYQSLAEWKDTITAKGEAYCQTLLKQAEAQVILNQYTENYVKLLEAQKVAMEGGDTWEWLPWNWGGKSAQEKADEKVREIEQEGEKIKKEYEKKLKEIDSIEEQYLIGDFAPQSQTGSTHSSGGGSGVDATKKAEENINQMRIKVMKEGLTKTIAQLRHERNRRIDEVRKNGIRVGEQVVLIEREYQNRVLQERLRYHQQMLQQERQFVDEISALQKEIWSEAYTTSIRKRNRELEESFRNLTTFPREIGDDINEYRRFIANLTLDTTGVAITAEGELTDRISEMLEIRRSSRQKYFMDIRKLTTEAADEELKIRREQIDDELRILQEAETKRYEQQAGILKNVFRISENGVQSDTATQNPILKALEEFKNLDTTGLNARQIGEELWEIKDEVDAFVNELESGFQNGLITFEEYNNVMQSTLFQTYKKAKDDYEEFLNIYNQQTRAWQVEHYDELVRFDKLQYEAFGKYLSNLETAYNTHENKMSVLQKKAIEDKAQAKADAEKKEREANALYYSNIINDLDNDIRDTQSRIDNLVTSGIHDFDFFNLNKLRKDGKDAVKAIQDTITELTSLRAELSGKLSIKEIEYADYEAASAQLDSELNAAFDALDEAQKKMDEGLDKMLKIINSYVQIVGQSIQTVLSSLWDYQDYQFDKEQESLDKMNEILEDKLQKQEEILQKHSDNVNSIEDELSSARGDRRQHLIDQLNAEIQAQREAAAEKKRLEKEEEKLKEQQDKLDKKRREAEYKRNLASILVQGAMAISSGLATSPFVPVGIAMGALATTLTAYQYAMAKKQKPYAKGGVLEGPSHKQGGIPVGNTGIEVEGNEYVVRKKSTRDNVPVLDFINRSERKLTLDDFIDFYSTKPKAAIKQIRTRFADGGTLPTNLDIKDQLQTIIINQDNRPITVSVVDINNKQADVRRVQALAGL